MNELTYHVSVRSLCTYWMVKLDVVSVCLSVDIFHFRNYSARLQRKLQGNPILSLISLIFFTAYRNTIYVFLKRLFLKK